MAIQFLIGGSGTGKTTYMINHMISQSMEADKHPILYILPEQGNLAAEQEMVNRHPMGGTMDISILSFTRLSFQVFDELGLKTHDILDDYGKSMLIMKVLKELQDELEIYKDMILQPGFVEEIKSMLSEFYQYQITESILEDAIERLDEKKSLYYKMKDFKKIFHAFSKELSGKYMVSEQVLSLLVEVADQSWRLKKATIYFDGFHGFTPIQYKVIEEFMKMGLDMYISITMDVNVLGKNDYGEGELFSISRSVYDRLLFIAQEHKVSVIPTKTFSNGYRFEGAAGLQHLEHHIFRQPGVAYSGDEPGVLFYRASDIEQEIQYVCTKIKEYVMDCGYHYKDFAIVTGDVSGDSLLLERYMNRMEIPYFLDYSEPLTHNPIIEVVWLLFEMYHRDFSYQSVFAFLKTGFLNLSMEDVYTLENYVIKYGVRGYGWWSKPFHGNQKGLKRINNIRQRFMEELEAVTPVFLQSKACAKEYIEAVYHFMCQNHMAEKLHEKEKEFEEENQLRESKTYGQVYEKWLMVLDKTMDLIGTDEIERETLAQLLVTGMSQVKLGIIPSTLDQVVVGDFERTRLPDVKILFVVGLNDGVIPCIKDSRGLLQDRERVALKKMDVELAPDRIEDVFLQQYYFYIQITKSCENVYFGYSLADKKGAEMKPSFYWNCLRSIFPEQPIFDVGSVLERIIPRTKNALIEEVAHQMMEDTLEDSSCYQVARRYYLTDLQQIEEGYLYQNQAPILDGAILLQLYGQHMVNSVSKLETYSSCCYHFFLEYGLCLKKREEYKVESNHIGTILHGVMERFFRKIKEESINLKELPKKERDALVEALTIQMAGEENETIFESGYRKKHQLQVLIRVAKRSVANLCRHLEQGDMKPEYFEKVFSPEDALAYTSFTLEHGRTMELKGIIDRVDIKETEDAVYFKVIDYKSGAKDIDYLKIYEGRQLQLAVYMSVIKELLTKKYPGKKIIPTGMYYFQMQDAIVDATEEDAEEKRNANSRLTGLVNEDEVCRQLMDEATGTVTPLRYKNDGSLYAQNKALVTGEELEAISLYVKNKITEIGNAIVDGRIDMNPEKGDKTGPCNFCDYKSICRFEPGLGGNHYNIHASLDKEQARRIVTGNGGEG